MKPLLPPPPPDPVDSWLDGPIDNERIRSALEGLPEGFRETAAGHVGKDHETLVTWIVVWVLTNWPDWDAHLASTCPTSLLGWKLSDKPFGGIQPRTSQDQSTVRDWVRKVDGWRAGLQTGSTKFFDHEKAHDVARFLLYEYIAPRKLGATVHEFIDVHLGGRDLPSTALNGLRETLSWANLQRFGKERWQHSIPSRFDKIVEIGKAFGGPACFAFLTAILLSLYPSSKGKEALLLLMIGFTTLATLWFARFVIRQLPKELREHRLRYPMGLVEDMAARWPQGRPRLLGDPGGYFAFLADYRTVFGFDAQDVMQWAIRRSWSSVVNPNFRNAFISHSHAQADLAHSLADALKARGLSIGLDAWSLQQDVDDPGVERWIIETIMSTDVIIYLLTNESAQSDWVRRETDWEFRLKTLKEWSSLPYCVVLDSAVDLKGYPPDRLVDGRALFQEGGGERLLDELAFRIWGDHFARLWQIRLLHAAGVRPKAGEEFLASVGIPEVLSGG